jgi:multidrug transporter EmrE-like cation transporter
MNALLLISIILGVTAQDVTKKIYNKKSSAPGTYFFVTLSALVAAIFFTLTSGSLSFNMDLIPYSAAFAVAYTTGVVGSVVAIASGPLSLTTLIVSFSLMLPTLYGLIFRNDPISIGLFPGLVLLAASLVLINKRDAEVKINPKWVISVIFAFLGNGFCTIAQNVQQVRFSGNYKSEFMIIALAITAVAALVMTLIKERKIIQKQSPLCYSLGVICGAANGAVNYIVMVLSLRMHASVMFPIISAGGILMAAILSMTVYREKLSKLQKIGLALGILAIIVLNI